MSDQITSVTAQNQTSERKTICTRVEFDCEVCKVRVVKWWHPNMPGRPRFCSRKCKSEFQRWAKPVSVDWLYQRYVVEGISCPDIAELVDRDSKSVWNWLKDLGIPRRTRGSDKRLHFAKGGVNLFAGRHHTPETLAILRGRKHTPETRAKLSAIAKADGRVPFDPKVGPNGGRRGKDHPSWKGGITPDRQKLYTTEAWKKVARQARKRDKYTCQRCGRIKQRGLPPMFDLHHVVSFECVALRAVVSNLVYLCEPCHYWVHGSENVNKDFIKEISTCQ